MSALLSGSRRGMGPSREYFYGLRVASYTTMCTSTLFSSLQYIHSQAKKDAVVIKIVILQPLFDERTELLVGYRLSPRSCLAARG